MLSDIIKELQETLKTSEAQREAEIIVEHVLNISPAEMVANPEMQVTKNQAQKIRAIRDRRNVDSEPLAYILEEADFMGYKLFVNSDVLVPRPETELLVEKVLEEIKARDMRHPSILDLGTGSGCIAIALKRALPAATVYASDISRGALSVAGINARRHKADITFVWGDYLDPFIQDTNNQSTIATPIMEAKPPYFDVIVSNPPYIPEADYADLEAELKHEPKHALVGFPYAQIRDQALGLQASSRIKAGKNPRLLKQGGFMAFEFGIYQSEQLKELFPQASIHKDLAGIDRMLVTK